MIHLIINSYLTILLSVGLGAVFVLLLGLYLILRPAAPRVTKKVKLEPQRVKPTATPKPRAVKNDTATAADESPADVTSIAGENIYSTQLDLARAYIETGKVSLAKKILTSVKAQGDAIQQQEAQQLLSTI